ncbi:MAG: RNA polymerase factor sigma-54 [Bacteroidales bacterium]|nr:RNA polymerase factor sigma-54 [Bacteroidales bacterium]MCF8389602.1 RNA polymerase factor sigma-54 [Bacteroidales bacterium]
MLKQSLQQKLLQKLSPQQIQMIKLLEIPTIMLEQRIKREMEENPTLEEGADKEDEYESNVEENDDSQNDQDEFTLEDYMDDDELPSYKLNANNYSKDDKFEEIPFSVGSSFGENLITQLGLRKLTEREEMLASYLIGNIDDDGYLRRKLEAIVDDLAFSMGIETNETELREVLDIIHDFDPPGIGARDLQECLLLQIKRKDLSNVVIKNTHDILKFHFDEFSKRHYDKIIARLNLSDDDMKDAISEVTKLNPKPGNAFSDPMNKTSEQIIPDFILENTDGVLQLSLNARNVPELRISRHYSDMLATYADNKKSGAKPDKDAFSFVKQKLDSARWFIDAIKQRQNTLLLTMNAILHYQEEYFLDGDEVKMKPMILKDIAEITNLDISTVSRVANSKYIQTHFGIYPLKYFFSEGMQTDSGEEVSTREIKKILEECISGEEKRKPLTDEKLSEILQEKGYLIARRTVAKYREQLNIPVARLRKEI